MALISQVQDAYVGASAAAPLPINRSVAKRCLDVVGALAGLVALSGLMLLIALAVRWDSPGPIFFTQRRLGKDGRAFTILKFRTMAPGREAARPDEHRTGLLFKQPEDPRVTRVGRWLRRTSLDELPQLVNILKGEMSLVGPRPLPVEDTRYYADWQWDRLAVLPGLTGLWQVSGRSHLSGDDMVRLDLSYIREWRLTADLAILVRTVGAVWRRDGAY